MKPYQFRLWNIINVPSSATYYPVCDPEHGRGLMEALADSQLLDDSIESNVFGLEILFEGSWVEWEDEHGNQITDEEADLTFLP